MKNPIVTLIAAFKSISAKKKPTEMSIILKHAGIERKWWMGEETIVRYKDTPSKNGGSNQINDYHSTAS